MSRDGGLSLAILQGGGLSPVCKYHLVTRGKAALGKSEQDRRIIESNHLAVLAASLHCTDEVNVVTT